jgi:predicted acylesterase/phospholipase RssA
MNAPIDLDDVGRRFCDLVMKGGITSGVVFPNAVARLSSQYRFRNIGGTSAGAIAAAGAAAAEYRRSTDRAKPEHGFSRLAELAAFLGERPDGHHTRLFRLFRPEPVMRRPFAILTAMLNRGGLFTRALHGGWAAMRHFPVAALAGALPGAILMIAAWGTTMLNALAVIIAAMLIVAGTVLAAGAMAVASLARTLPEHEFGMVRGHATDADTAGAPALTDWFYPYLQELAGKDLRQPLTFGDLDDVVLDERAGIRGINLQMMTTALSMGRPFSLPFTSEQFYFKPSELARFFPAEVLDWMIAHPGPRAPANRARDEAMTAFGYRPFPSRATLPVVVAVRMSLSFPLLLSGIPLYRYAWEAAATADRERDDTQLAEAGLDPIGEASAAQARTSGRRRFDAANVRKVLFSDGGICSNFPVHLFDSVLPGWPTFGINLRDDLPAAASDADRAYLTDRGKSLPPENFAIAEHGSAGVISFAAAIVRTMQNWRDNLQRAAPGFRDRVVTIRHTKQEGGLNLDMAPRDIDAMAKSGDLGAQQLIDTFAHPESAEDDRFTYHRWVRVRSLLNVSQRVLREIHEGATVLENHPPYPDLVRDAPAYVGASYRLSETARNAAAHLLDTLDRLEHELTAAHVDYARTAPRPEVELRIQPVW